MSLFATTNSIIPKAIGSKIIDNIIINELSLFSKHFLINIIIVNINKIILIIFLL